MQNQVLGRRSDKISVKRATEYNITRIHSWTFRLPCTLEIDSTHCAGCFQICTANLWSFIFNLYRSLTSFSTLTQTKTKVVGNSLHCTAENSLVIVMQFRPKSTKFGPNWQSCSLQAIGSLFFQFSCIKAIHLRLKRTLRPTFF